MSADLIRYEIDGGVGLITLNRPEKHNAVTSEMLRSLLNAITDAAADDDVRAVLITGAGTAFCVGQDLSDPSASGDEPILGALLEERWNPVIRELRAIRKPVVVAVNGTAAGAGMSLALAGISCSPLDPAKFTLAFSAVGLVPDSGAPWALPRLVGPARARALSMVIDSLTAEEALELGMIWQVVDDDALLGEAAILPYRWPPARRWRTRRSSKQSKPQRQTPSPSSSTWNATCSESLAGAMTTRRGSPPSWKSASRASRGR